MPGVPLSREQSHETGNGSQPGPLLRVSPDSHDSKRAEIFRDEHQTPIYVKSTGRLTQGEIVMSFFLNFTSHRVQLLPYPKSLKSPSLYSSAPCNAMLTHATQNWAKLHKGRAQSNCPCFRYQPHAKRFSEHLPFWQNSNTFGGFCYPLHFSNSLENLIELKNHYTQDYSFLTAQKDTNKDQPKKRCIGRGLRGS